MKHFALALAMLSLLATLGAATWTGSWNTDWNNPSNWNPSAVPGMTTDVTIPNVTNKPVVSTAFANCRDLTIQTGSRVTISGSYNLIAQNNVIIYGQLAMSSTGDLQVGNGLFWENGATANITNNGATIYVTGNAQFASGSNVQLGYGTLYMWGSLASTDLANYSPNTQLNALMVAKNTGTSFSIRSGGQPFTINNALTNSSGNTFYNYYTGDITLKGNIVDNNSDPAYGFRWDNGTLILDGGSQNISLQSTSSYLKNLTCSQTGIAQLIYPLTLKGKLRIENGALNPQSHNITLAGDWENTVGPDAFTEGTTARVIFNGSAHQYVNNTENFHIIELYKSGGALRVNSSAAVVSCDHYDWTAGAVDVLTGTFTASDLLDNGIFGSWYVNPGGVINLTNNDGWVDLNGSMTFTNGGTINVWGGTGTSFWSYGGNASLTMNGGGILDFKNVGINIYNSASYSLSCSINNPDCEIRTVGDFSCNRASFAPASGKVVMYGGYDATLTMSAGSLFHLSVDKASTREEASAPFIDSRSGERREATRSNTVNLATNVIANPGTFEIISGVCNLQSYQLSCFRARVNGTLRMHNSAAKLYAENQIIWHETGIADITLGTLETRVSWDVRPSANVILPVAVVTNLTGTSASTISNASTTFQFGTLNIGGTSTTGGVYTLTGNQNILVAGNLTIRSGNELDLGTRDLTVNGDLNLNGTLEIHTTSATVQGKLELAATSTLFINSGALTSNSTTVPRTTNLRGTFTLNTGILTLTNNSLTVLSSAVNNISGGTIYCDGIIAQHADTFRPTGGTVHLGDLYGGGTFANWVGANNWVHHLTVDAGSQGYRLDNALVITGNFTLLSGLFDVQNSSAVSFNITISGNWSHQGGTFYPRSGRVILNGSAHQYCNYTETFNILETNKSAGALRVDSSTAVVTIASYDWTAGSLDVLTGTLTLLDLADNGMFGGYYCTPGGTLNITQDASSRIDLNGTLQITGGAVNIYGGSVYACWPFAAPASLTMSSGSLTYHDQGIYIYNSAHAFSYNITGGNIYTTRGIYCNRPNFNPAGGSFRMTGSYDAVVNFSVPTSSLFNLRIDKPGAPAWTVSLSDDLSCRGSVSVAAGKLSLNGQTLNCTVAVYVYAGSYLELGPASVLALGNGGLLSVLDSGNVSLLGSADYAARITRISDGYYDVYLQAYSVFAANYALFEYTGLEGLEFASDSIINSLDNCTFRYGQTGGRYLSFVTHSIVVNNAHFPMSNGGYNVYKTMGVLGSIIMANATGSFAGPAYEYDPANAVFWTGSAVDLQITGVDWSRPDDYVCAPVTATVTVVNNGAHDIITPFRVDLYRNSLSLPAAGTLGDHFLTIPTLNAGAEASVTFTNVSTDIPGTWRSWFRVDTDNLVPETNEANNYSYPAIVTNWLPLPGFNSVAIESDAANSALLSWDYPVPVYTFSVFASDDPGFVPGPENLLFGLPGEWNWITITPGLNRRFYAIKAVRVLP